MVSERRTCPGRARVTDPLRDGDRRAGNVVSSDLDLPAVDPDADVQRQRLDCLSDLHGAAHGPCTAIEAGQEAIANGLDLSALVLLEGCADNAVVLIEEVAPSPGTESGRSLGGAHDVGEQDGRQDYLSLRSLVATGEEVFNLVNQAVGVAHEEKMIITGQ